MKAFIGRELITRSLVSTAGYVPVSRRIDMMILAGRKLQHLPQFYDMSLSRAKSPNYDLSDKMSDVKTILSSFDSWKKENAALDAQKRATELRESIIREYEAGKASAASTTPPVSPTGESQS